MNIVFMGTPDFAKESLKSVVEAGYNIQAVVTNTDKPKGRGMKMLYSPVKEYALEKNLPILQPEKIRNNDEFLEEIKKLNPDIICVVAYGKIIPKTILDIPKYGCINVHGSLLPKYRGAAPIQWAVLNGDSVTGVTTMYMNEKMDEGDIILKEEVEIGENETTGELWEKLSKLGSKLLVKTLRQIEEGTAPRIKQDSNFTLAPMLNKEIAKIDWGNMTSSKIKNLVRGLNPIMGAYSYIDNKKIKFWKVKIQEEYNKSEEITPGTIIEVNSKTGVLVIKTIDSAIAVQEIQAENSKKMNIADFLRGANLQQMQKFE